MKKFIIAAIILFTVAAAHSQPAISDLEKEGTAYYQQGKSAEAIASFKKALIGKPQSLYSMNALANLYLMDQKYQDAYLVADQGLKLSNGGPNFIVVKAKAAIRLNRAQEAITMIDKYLATHQPDFMMLFVKGTAFNVLGDRQQALTFFSQSIVANPDFPDAYLGRAKDLADIERFEQALKDYDKYISLRDDNPDAYHNRGTAYFHTAKFNDALADCNRALALSPKAAETLTLRGEVYEALQQSGNAITDFNASISADPNYAAAYYQAAGALMNAKEYEKALPYINKAISLIPNAAVYYWIQARLYLYTDKNNEALTAANKAVELDAKSPEGYMWKASALFNLEKYDDAVKIITQGITINPDYYLLYTLRASMYRDKGNTALADADDLKAKQLAANIK